MAAVPTPTTPVPPRSRSRVGHALRAGEAHLRWQRRTGDLLEASAVLGAVAVVVLFLRDGGSRVLTSGSLSSVLEGVGRVTGLLAVDSLLLQLLLAARVPWVDRVYGMDRALKAHRVLGRISLPLVLIHVEALVLSYASRDRLSPLLGWAVEPFRMLRRVPDMVTAALATALLVVVAVTSIRRAARSLGYERWHLVHLTAYAAVMLSVPHQLSIGSDLAGSSWSRAYWLALYGVVAASLLWWRVIVPVVRTVGHGLRVESVVPEGPDSWSVVMSGRGLDRMPLRAGQYLGFRFLSRGLWTSAHPWSVSAHPDGHRIRITVRELGDHSRRIGRLRPGTPVLIEGPYGSFTTASRVRRRVLLLAAGIGVTPIRALLEEIVREGTAGPGDVTVVVRANSRDELVLVDELDELCRQGGHPLHVLVGPVQQGSWFPESVGGGDDAGRLLRIVPRLDAHEVYLCGPAPWMDLVHESLERAGVAGRRVHDERFGW
jgi:predicted ferric reductase